LKTHPVKKRDREGAERRGKKGVGAGEPRQPVTKEKNQGQSQFLGRNFGRQKFRHLTAQKISNFWAA
jgi:hypothetical protein